MTLLEIQNSIIQYLTKEKKDFISLSEDTLKKLLIINTKENKDKTGKFKDEVIPSVELALDDMTKRGLFSKSSSITSPFWVLVRPLEMYPQTIEIGKITADAVANTINEYCEETENKEDLADRLQITEYDVQKLIMIISKLNNVLAEISQAERESEAEKKDQLIVA